MKHSILLIFLAGLVFTACTSESTRQELEQKRVEIKPPATLPDSTFGEVSTLLNDADTTLSKANTYINDAASGVSKAETLISLADSARVNAQVAIARKNLEEGKRLIARADSLLAIADKSIASTDQSLEQTQDLRRKSKSLIMKSGDLIGKTVTIEQKPVYAMRRLLVPGEPWDFDQPLSPTTDPRVNPILFLSEFKPSEEFLDQNRTVSKDDLTFQFRIHNEWRGSEKYHGKVVSYLSPDSKIIVTLNESPAYIDSLHFWAAIYEASAYGKNQLSGFQSVYSKEKMGSLGADQSYIAKYHYRDREVSAIFLQKDKTIVSCFVEYPNGSLSDHDVEKINYLLTTVKFK